MVYASMNVPGSVVPHRRTIQTYECVSGQTHLYYDQNTFAGNTFSDHTRAYLEQRAERPWLLAESVNPTDGIKRVVVCTFTDKLLEEMLQRPHEWEKDITAALKYGYIAHTNGGRNGIVPLRTTDCRMRARVAHYRAAQGSLLEGYEITGEAEGVKIVTHRRNGLRAIGVRSPANNHVLFFDRMTYKA